MNDSFPYNETQRLLHLPEEMVLRNIKHKVKRLAKNPKDEKELYQRELDFLEEIKNQNPHPKEIFKDNPVCFWDTDVYWLHWKKNKLIIIERAFRCMRHRNLSLKGAVLKTLSILEQFYSPEEIMDVIGHCPDPMVGVDVRKIIFESYGQLERTRTFKWGASESVA
ncbi:MAG: hypothetical protein OXC92_10510 [Flavobacteriaceae bacterium]|nr:hypothetical protein [Flavobacteriaceae bacterium]MCY4217401.1 hypothetical protein [Flavobacteriaceae bacterium]MCY4266969.1 hypothetical protein [Flavobacteriaceae bacterium]MCY4299015.1 hypothetical protein [Flavobacteriaceae bacterium]